MLSESFESTDGSKRIRPPSYALTLYRIALRTAASSCEGSRWGLFFTHNGVGFHPNGKWWNISYSVHQCSCRNANGLSLMLSSLQICEVVWVVFHFLITIMTTPHSHYALRVVLPGRAKCHKPCIQILYFYRHMSSHKCSLQVCLVTNSSVNHCCFAHVLCAKPVITAQYILHS